MTRCHRALPRIAITPGEPAGIGPELVVQLAQQQHAAQLIAVADPALLQQRAELLELPLTLKHFDADTAAVANQPGELTVLPIELAVSSHPGQLDPANAGYVLETLAAACDGCLRDDFDAMLTAPVNKAVINDAGVSFSGHTEFLAERTGSEQVVMMLATEGLRVALVTTHLPLCEVPAAITAELLSSVSHILQRDLQQHFAIEQPRILALGLNPHAGEGGHMGREEIDTIIPAIKQLRAEGLDISDPLPADTAFNPQYLDNCDAVLAMYHDQGLPVLKYKGFGRSVNITLGLPIIRTSVDHGTALELAGTGRADCGSLQTALDYAITLADNRAMRNKR